MSRLLLFLSTTCVHQVSRMSTLPDIPVVTNISKNLIRILGCNPGQMTLQGTNTYLIGSGRRRILVDTGDSEKPQYTDALNQLMTAEQVEIDKILITHWHHDHIDGVRDVTKLNGAKNAEIWKFPRSDETESYDFPVKFLQDGQQFPIDGEDNDTLTVVHTPGHTTDHVILTLASDNSLFSGDCILGEGTAVFEDLFDYMQSLDKILKLKPSVIYPGHGNIVNDPMQKIEYYIKHRQQRENQILDCLQSHPDQAFTAMEIVEQVYMDTPKELYPAAAYNVHHHLTKLAKENKIIRVSTDRDGDDEKWQFKSGTTHKL